MQRPQNNLTLLLKISRWEDHSKTLLAISRASNLWAKLSLPWDKTCNKINRLWEMLEILRWPYNLSYQASKRLKQWSHKNLCHQRKWVPHRLVRSRSTRLSLLRCQLENHSLWFLFLVLLNKLSKTELESSRICQLGNIWIRLWPLSSWKRWRKLLTRDQQNL